MSNAVFAQKWKQPRRIRRGRYWPFVLFAALALSIILLPETSNAYSIILTDRADTIRNTSKFVEFIDEERYFSIKPVDRPVGAIRALLPLSVLLSNSEDCEYCKDVIQISVHIIPVDSAYDRLKDGTYSYAEGWASFITERLGPGNLRPTAPLPGFAVASEATTFESDIAQLHMSSEHGHSSLFAHCNINKFAQTCSLMFSLSCKPDVGAEVSTIKMALKDHFTFIARQADQFIAKRIVSDDCGRR